ncbi:hypothetical protein [Streptomyces sp. NPDC058745]|uniref:hypothetical protein n=1 Tax=Streptomyces sp. NPDC058745 TaxID=3346621 RepID=UPI00367E5BBB
MGWMADGFPSHVGSVGVLLSDGSEPGPVYYDTGSSAFFHESTDWWVYDGTLNAPRAQQMRARCACGWRAESAYLMDWDSVERGDPDDYDTSDAERDWKAHVDAVRALTVPLPTEVSDLMEQLRQRLDRLVDDAPLAALKAVSGLESIIALVAPPAAYFAVRAGDVSWQQIAEGLGTTEDEARSRLMRYERQ